MDTRKIVIAAGLVTMVVFGWSMAMAAMGHVALIASLAPILGLTVQQVVPTVRSRTTPASEYRVAAVPDKEDGAP